MTTPFKLCTKCGQEKPLREFHRSGRRRHLDGLSNDCKACVSDAYSRRHAANPEKFRERNRQSYARCREKKLDYCKRRKQENPEKVQLIQREADAKHHYGMTLADRAAKFCAQNGRCLLCGEPMYYDAEHNTPESVVQDHCHATGTLRGLVHKHCNGIIWVAESYLQIAAKVLSPRVFAYLDAHANPPESIVLRKVPQRKKVA